MNPDDLIPNQDFRQSTILICAETNYGVTVQQAISDFTSTLLSVPDKIPSIIADSRPALVIVDADTILSLYPQLIRSIRGHFPTTELPILVLYSDSALNIRNAALADGANDCLRKPLDSLEAVMRVNQCLTLAKNCITNKTTQSILEAEIKSRTEKLDMLIDSGLMMAMEKSRSKLLKHILVEGQRLLNCDGGTMYLVSKENTLRFAERTRDDYLPFQEIALFDPLTGNANEVYASTYAALHRKSVVINNVYQETRFDCSGTRDFDARSGYHTISLLTVPMAPRDGKVIGILQFFNAKSAITGEIISFAPDVIELVEALSAQAAVALDNLQLVQAQKDTIESIIRLVAQALDSKSPQTGHHCVRVPELAVLLAEAACEVTEGPLAEFKFKTEDEWFEFRVGAWLHDCGKVTTPDYVIDKATKLDAFYNRIHEIRTRFEVLLRDAEIAYLKARLDGANAADAEARFQQRRAALADDFKFIAACNLGNEAMAETDVERIKTIAQEKWTPHFDPCLGLSYEDLAHRSRESAARLPVEENLLCDQPYHIIRRNPNQKPNSELGIKMNIPENLCNFGEVYNLCIQRGTLTDEDRYKINEHIIETIRLIERMPLPESLKRIPEYATTHHERLDGKGYPRKLSATDLSVPARIMAIADIFEALTSTERSYKRPYKLSETLQILYKMKQENHIDRDLFELLLTSGTYLKFAEQFLEPEQIDEIDIKQFIDS